MKFAELHCHLEACLRLSTLKELVPSVNPNSLVLQQPAENLAEALKCFDVFRGALFSPEVIERMAFEAVEDAHAQGLSLVEYRYAPNYIASIQSNLTFQKIHDAIVKGVNRGTNQFGVKVGLIGIVVRTDPMQDAERTADFIIDNKNTFVGMDLAGAEIGFPALPFSALFLKAKKAGLGITIHAGESDTPDAAQSVLDAIHRLGAERIGHGLQIYKNPAVMAEVARSGVTLELCPTSNWLTQCVPALAAHPIRRIMEAGVKVTVNSDDPIPFGTTFAQEVHLLRTVLGFTDQEIATLMDNAFAASFV